MHPPCEVAIGRFDKGPQEGGFTRYFTGVDPAAQVPQPGDDLKAFDQGPRCRNVPHCSCQKGPHQINRVSFRSVEFFGDTLDEAFRANHFKHRHKTLMVFQRSANFGLRLGK